MKPVTNTRKALALGIAVLSLFACLAGLAPGTPRPDSPAAFTSIRGQSVELQGTGLYRLDSVSFAAQAKAQDLVTLFLGIPLLILSLVFAARGSLRRGFCWPAPSGILPIPTRPTPSGSSTTPSSWSTSRSSGHPSSA